MGKSKKRSETASRGDSVATADRETNAQRDEHANGDARDRVALRAYELYLARGGSHGGDFDDWLTAERELAGSNDQTEGNRHE